MAAAAGPVVESLTTAISAAVAAVAGKFIIYPLDFFKLRLSAKQEHETAGSIFADVYKKHGILGVYLGLGPRLVRSFAQKFNYFYVYEALLQLYASMFPGKAIGAVANLLIGFIGDIGCIPVIVPLELLSMQMSEGGTWGGVIKRTYAKSGLAGFYSGWTGYAIGAWLPAIQYTVFDQAKFYWLNRIGGATELSILASFVIGAISRAIADIVTYPATCCQNVQQSQHHPLKDESFFGVFFGIYKTQGMGGLYNGIVPQLSQGVLGSAIMMVIKEKIQNLVRTGILLAFVRKAALGPVA